MGPSPSFVSEPIRLLEGDAVKGPRRFAWRDSEYEVDRVLRGWHDFGSPATTTRPNWRTRRHRNVFDVVLDDGRTARIYVERGTKRTDRRTWVLERFLAADPGSE